MDARDNFLEDLSFHIILTQFQQKNKFSVERKNSVERSAIVLRFMTLLEILKAVNSEEQEAYGKP